MESAYRVDISETSEAVIQVLLDRSSLKMEDLHQVVATGYGRKMCRFAGRSVTEITCHAAGAFHLVKDAETVLDIGGQDVKVIRLDIEGKVTDFLMNDRCRRYGTIHQQYGSSAGLQS